ncbi:imm11 family protein [Sphingomonas sp. CJ20]
MTWNSGERRRFYLVDNDTDYNASDFSFVNKHEALIGGRWGGTHEFPRKGRPIPAMFGIPPLRTSPALVVGVDDDRLLDMYGLGKRYVSTRAKALLSAIDPDAFEFAECITVDGTGGPVEPYWMMDVIRVIEKFDEEKSNVVRYNERFPTARDAPTNNGILMLNDMHFLKLPWDVHAFYLIDFTRNFIFDELMKVAWHDAGLTGVRFTPLQPPTASELEQRDRFTNYPYWSENRK